MRNFNREFEDTKDRLYAYNFDYIMHDYMLKSFKPWMQAGKALEMGCYKGEFTKLLANHFDHITVIEAASDLIAETKKNILAIKRDVEFINDTFVSICRAFNSAAS